jgi:hypothetical protein
MSIPLLFAALHSDAIPPPEPFELPPVDPVDDVIPPPSDAPKPGPAKPNLNVPEGTPASPNVTVDGERRVGNPEPFTREHGFSLGVVGKGGYSIGHVWSVPYWSVPSPGVGLRARYRLRLNEWWRLTTDGTVSIGGSDDGSIISVGSYRATFGVGRLWFDLGWLQWWTTMHLGFESFLLIPVPLVGVSNELVLMPIRWSWLIWSITGVLDTDLYVIVPSITVALSTAVVVPIWFTWVGAEVLAEGQGIVAGVANAAGASVQARMITGFVF